MNKSEKMKMKQKMATSKMKAMMGVMMTEGVKMNISLMLMIVKEDYLTIEQKNNQGFIYKVSSMIS